MSPFTPRDTVSSPPAGVELNALPPGHVLRSTLRICAGLLVVILGMLACTLALFTAVTPDRFTFVTWLVSIFLLLAGFAGLAVTRVPWAPLRPTRIALAVSVIIAGFMLPMSAYPLRALGMGSVATLVVGIPLSICATVWALRSPRITLVMLGLLAAYGVLALGHYGLGIVLHGGGRGLDPTLPATLMLAESLAVAWIAACWHARWLWNALPSRSMSSQSPVATGMGTMHQDA